MTAPAVKERPLRKIARRGFFGTLGAGGLTTASAVFGKTAVAYATCKRRCCNLANCPNVAYNWCATHSNYVWRCCTSTYCCGCCEAENNTASAYKC